MTRPKGPSPPPDLPTALGLLLGLRHRYPQVDLGWDRRENRPVARPASLLRQHPTVVAELTDAKERISPLLKWEDRNGRITLTDNELEMLDWLYNRASEGLYPPTFQLWPWTSVVNTIGAFDALRIEAAQGPAYPGWGRVKEDLARLMEMERTGQL